MILSELFESLAGGELQNLAMAENGAGSIVESVQPRIVRYANEALLRLYARMVLKENDLLIEMQQGVTFYHLVPRFALNYVPTGTADNEIVRYILDLPQEKFTGDVIRILSVFDGATRRELPLNDDANPYSVFTPQANTLQVPLTTPGNSLSVVYQARHPKLQGDLEENIEVPEYLEGAFTAYIAYKVFSHMNTAESTNKAQEHLGMYESICTDAVDKALIGTSVSTVVGKFDRGGWA